MTAGHGPQISRISRLLDVQPSDVHGLGDIPDDDLRTLHDAISASIFGAYEQRFARIAALSNLIPGPLAGKLAERFLPPTLGARCAEQLEPTKARELVSKVSVRYLADLALALNPTKSEPVVRAIPADHIGAVARELFGRGEYAAMAEFAGTVTLDALVAALGVASGADLLEVVPLLVWNDNIDKVVDDIPDRRVEEIVRDIVDSCRWEDASRLIERLNPAKAGDLVAKVPLDALAALATELDPDRLAPIVAAIPATRIRDVAAGMFARHDYAAMARFVGAVPVESISAALEVATGADLLAVAELIEVDDSIVAIFDHIPDRQIDDVLRTIADAELWDGGSQLIERLTPELRARALTRVRALSDDTFAALDAAASAGKLGSAAAQLLADARSLRGGVDR